jgi:hypothetical protein
MSKKRSKDSMATPPAVVNLDTPMILISVGLVVGVLVLLLVAHMSRKMNCALGGIYTMLHHEEKGLAHSSAEDCPLPCQKDDRGNCTYIGRPCEFKGASASVLIDNTVPLTQAECKGRCAWNDTTRACADMHGYPCYKMAGASALEPSKAHAEDEHGFRHHGRLDRD